MEIINPNVAQLWKRLEDMEDELRFDGKAYPEGMCSFPFRLQGQGFFPGGDGLWRSENALSVSSDGVLPVGGVVFLANDFGVLKSYEKLEAKGFENVPTWRHIKLRVEAAGIPPELAFFTNAIIGLRVDGKALSQRSWQLMPGFSGFCRDFLDFQLATLKPTLTVVMGDHARSAFEALGDKSAAGRVLYTTHPYADFGLSTQRRAAGIAELSNTWSCIVFTRWFGGDLLMLRVRA
jgi:hypothetical protein